MPSGDIGEEQNQKFIDRVQHIQIYFLIYNSILTAILLILPILDIAIDWLILTDGMEDINAGYKQLNNLILQLTINIKTFIFKMSLIEESYLQCLLNNCQANFGREEKEAQVAVLNTLAQIYTILKRNVKQTFANFSLEVIVRFMQFAVQIENKFVQAEDFVNLFFQRVTAPCQFYIRALLVKAKLIAYRGHKNQLKGQAMILVLKQSILQINKALDLISGPNQPAQKGKDSKGGADSNKSKYAFLIFNASTCLYKIIRFMLRQNWQKNFTEIIERIYKLFDQIDEPDQNWRCRFMLILFQCLYDSDKKPDAWKILDLLWDKAKTKNVDFLDSLFRLRVHYSKQNNALTNVIKKDIQGADPNGWKILEVLQRMRSGAIPQAQIQKQLMGVVNQISLGVLSTNEQSASVTLSHIMQERLGEAGRIALKFNIISIASSITNFLAKARQPNQKAMVLNQYNKAELLIKKKNQFIDKKTGMMMNAAQIKQLEIQRRKQALKILQKVMMANKKLDNPDLIYEGAVLIWNISLPFLCVQYREFIAKAFDYSCQLLQQIQSIDHDLRTKMHLELAKIYFGNEKMFPQVEKNIRKALKLDHSIPTNKLQHKFEPEEDPSLYYRPLERYLQSYRQKILLKTLSLNQRSNLDDVINDLWNVAEQKSQTARIDILQKSLRNLMSIQQEKFVVDESKMMVEQEIKQQKILFEQKKLKNYKKKKLLAYQIAQFSFEWELNDFAKKASKFVLEDKWEGKNSIELIIAQARCCYFLAQIYIDQLIQDNFQIPYAETVLYQNDDQKQGEVITQQKKKEVETRKKSIFDIFTKGLQLSQSIQQHWLVFNGAIYTWNNFLHVFRNPINDSRLHKDLCALLKKFFESMKNSLKQIEAKGIVYYDLDNKIQTFANIGLVYARLMETQKQPDQVIKICDALLVTPLSPHTRKLTNSMKARVIGSGGAKGAAGGKDQKKGGKDVPQQKAGGYSDSFLFQIFSQLQIIQNSTNKTETQNLIKKCFENLQNWQPKDKDETQLELHAQLWARLGRLAVNQANTTMYKYALRCSQYSLSLHQNQKNISNIPANRLRWYSLSQFLYSQCLYRIANPETQDTESYEKLLFAALQHAVQAAHKGFKSNINALVADGAKQVWNVCSKLQQSKKNRAKLIQPIKTVLYYLKEIKEQNEPDLILLLAQLFFKAANENNQSKVGEQVADMLFNVVPKNMQKSLWEAKMVFMSKQGKNQLQAISNMKQADPSLQSKLWVKLARIATNPKKQHAAYNKAIDILKKQNSIEIVEVLIQYSEWQLRVGNEKIKNVASNLLLASDFLIDIEYGQEDDEQDDNQQDKGTVFSRSTRGKKSHTSKSVKSSIKSSKLAKKPTQKKGPSSIKSKSGSGMSRMNRSGRAAKTIKSKNTKSIFSERQQDPNPQSLNCIHFQRLFRIHTILAMISDTVSNRIRYALDAKQFLIKILDLSFQTLNKIQQNSLKFSDKNKKTEEFELKLPSDLKDWVNFQLTKQIIDKVKTLEDPNFMGSYAFQKPELTYAYLKNLTSILNTYGLNYHTIPVYFFQKFIANELLGNKNHYQIAELQLKLTLRKIGYQDAQKPALTQITSQKYKIPELELKMQLIKSQSKVVVEPDTKIFQNFQPPNLVQSLNNHEAWFQIGKLLIQFGQLYSAKNYLRSAYQHFMILSNTEQAGQCCIELLKIAGIEGQNEQAMEHALNANKLCKHTKNWKKLLYHSCKLLLSLRKYEDIANFASKIYSTIEQLIFELNKQNCQKLIFQSELIQLKDILTLIQIIDLDVRFTQSYQEQIADPVKGILHAIKQIQDRVVTGDLWALDNYVYFLAVATHIVEFFIFGKEKNSHINVAVFEKIFSLILKIEKKLFDLMKYTLIGAGNQFRKNSLIQIYQKYRYTIASAYSYQSTLSIIGQKLSQQDEQSRDLIGDLVDLKNQHFKKYMDTLNLQIQKKMMPVPLNLPPIQSSISILQNIKANLSMDSYQGVQWAANYIRALTLKARSIGALDHIWSSQSKDTQSDQASLSLDSMKEFLQKSNEEKLLDFSKNTKCFESGQKLYEALIQNTGQQMTELSFQFLCKLQHCSYSTKILEIIRKNLSPTHKLNSFLNLIQSTKLEGQKIKGVLTNDKIFNSFSKFPKYEDCLALVPRNSVYVVIQLNSNLSEFYCGFLTNQKNEQEYQLNTKIYKQKIEKSELMSYFILKQKLNKIKKQIVYLAYSDSKKLDSILNQKVKDIQQIHDKFAKMSNWWLQKLHQILNKVKEVQTPPEVDKNKKAAKDTKKKGGKDQVAGYQSPLGASPAGFQSITFLVDEFFEGFAFNLLPGLQSVPAIAFDSSIFYLSRKMQAIGYKSQANNSNGFGADKGRYISYQFKSPQLGFKSISANITKQTPTIKFQGVSTNDRIPSVGDYKKYINQLGYLQVYGSLDLLNHIKAPILLQNCGTAKLKLLIISDHLNYEKALINKFINLDDESQPNSIDNQQKIYKAIANLLDLSLIKNTWCSSKQHNLKAILTIYKNLGSGYYLGACLNSTSAEEAKQRILEKYMYRIYGCPVLRM